MFLRETGFLSDWKTQTNKKNICLYNRIIQIVLHIGLVLLITLVPVFIGAIFTIIEGIKMHLKLHQTMRNEKDLCHMAAPSQYWASTLCSASGGGCASRHCIAAAIIQNSKILQMWPLFIQKMIQYML